MIEAELHFGFQRGTYATRFLLRRLTVLGAL